MATAEPAIQASSGLFAAIDVGTNATRLELARLLPDGTLRVEERNRDPIRPGEGVFETGAMPSKVVERLLKTMHRYAHRCETHGAVARAVATSAMREARNAVDVQTRIRKETGIQVEIISGEEEARLICLGVLKGRPPDKHAIVIDIGGGSTEVIFAQGESPGGLWSLPLGTVRLTEMFHITGKVPEARLRDMRDHAREVIRKHLRRPLHPSIRIGFGCSGTIKVLSAFAADDPLVGMTGEDATMAAEALAVMSPKKRAKFIGPQRADIIVAGAVILEAFIQHTKLDSVFAVKSGLRDGVLYDLVRRSGAHAR